MSTIDLEGPTPITDHKNLVCTQRESETNKNGRGGEVGTVQQSDIIQHQHDDQVRHWQQARRCIMEIRHARSRTKRCVECYCK